MPPPTRPMLLETFATSGGYPNSSSVGNVASVPEPTTTLIIPAQNPAARIASASTTPTMIADLAGQLGQRGDHPLGDVGRPREGRRDGTLMGEAVQPQPQGDGVGDGVGA